MKKISFILCIFFCNNFLFPENLLQRMWKKKPIKILIRTIGAYHVVFSAGMAIFQTNPSVVSRLILHRMPDDCPLAKMLDAHRKKMNNSQAIIKFLFCFFCELLRPCIDIFDSNIDDEICPSDFFYRFVDKKNNDDFHRSSHSDRPDCSTCIGAGRLRCIKALTLPRHPILRLLKSLVSNNKDLSGINPVDNPIRCAF